MPARLTRLAPLALLVALAAGPAGAGGLRTDLSKALVPLDEIIPGGPPPDGVTIGSAARAYPWPMLAKRGVVHDTVAGERLAIFYRPGAQLRARGRRLPRPGDREQLEPPRPRARRPTGRQAAPGHPARGRVLVRLGGAPPLDLDPPDQ